MGLGHHIKGRLLLGMAMCVACTALLLAQNKQSTTEQKAEPPAAKSNQKNPNPPGSVTSHGPIDILSDTGGVDVHPYLNRALSLLKESWYERIPETASYKRGKVTIKFHILKDGQITDVLYVDRTGDPHLDLPAYLGVTGSNPLPSLPSDFGCKFLALQIRFYYNPEVDPSEHGSGSLIPCVTTRINSVQSVAIAVSPSSAEVVTGAKQQFAAVVTGDPRFEVKWIVSGSGCSGFTCGSVSPQGLYSAPSIIPNPPRVMVTVTLASDPTDTATATVTVVRPTNP